MSVPSIGGITSWIGGVTGGGVYTMVVQLCIILVIGGLGYAFYAGIGWFERFKFNMIAHIWRKNGDVPQFSHNDRARYLKKDGKDLCKLEKAKCYVPAFELQEVYNDGKEVHLFQADKEEFHPMRAFFIKVPKVNEKGEQEKDEQGRPLFIDTAGFYPTNNQSAIMMVMQNAFITNKHRFDIKGWLLQYMPYIGAFIVLLGTGILLYIVLQPMGQIAGGLQEASKQIAQASMYIANHSNATGR